MEVLIIALLLIVIILFICKLESHNIKPPFYNTQETKLQNQNEYQYYSVQQNNNYNDPSITTTNQNSNVSQNNDTHQDNNISQSNNITQNIDTHQNNSINQKNSTNSYMPYKKRKLLTYTEYNFYKIMKKACDEKNLLICPKVRLEDFIDVTDKKNRMKYRGYIKSRHVDFIITDSKLNLLCGIELDDPSHQKPEAAKTDAFKNELFQTINIPLFRIDTTTKYEIWMNYIFRQLKIIPESQTYQAEQATKQTTKNIS